MDTLAPTVAKFLIPVPLPVFLIFSIVLGGMAVPFLLHVTKDRSAASLELREGALGFALFISVIAFMLWLLVAAVQFSRLPEDNQDGGEMVGAALFGLVYGACVFGLCSFVAVFGNLVYRLVRPAPAPQTGPTPEELARRAEQDRLRNEEERRRREEETRRHDFQQQSLRRRQEARSQCELLFNLHQADIAKRFTRKMFDDYMTKYMADTEDADIVERRGRELREIIEKSLEQTGGRAKPTSIDQLATWFLDEKKRIESLPIDEELKEDHLAHLNIRYAELSQQILEQIRP